MNTAYKFRLYPNKKQRELIGQTLGCVRFVYNYYLALHIDEYEFCGKYLSFYDSCKNLTELKQLYSFLREPDKNALQTSLRNLDVAFKNFFRQPNVGYPKFKRKSSQGSYTTYQKIKMHERHVTLPKLGKVRARIHREVPDNYVLKSATISQTATGKYYVSVLFEHESQVPKVAPRTFLGLDYSSPNLYIDSNGNEPDYPRFFRKTEAKLACEQRKLSKMVRGGKNYVKQRLKVARIHEKIANQRRDFLHKLSRNLADNYDVIGIEDLNMKGLSQSLNLGKSTMDNGWSMFTTFLRYKLERRGGQLIVIDKFFPSTKICHECGNVKPVRLNERQYVCPECGMIFDRDWNAAINIMNEAKRIALQ